MQNSQSLAADDKVREFVTRTLESGGVIGALCASPALVLGSWDLLNGKKFTCYPGMGGELKTKPLANERVVKDGNIITACSAGAAEEFLLPL